MLYLMQFSNHAQSKMLKKTVNTFLVKILTAVINLAVAILISQWLGAGGKGTQGLFVATLAMTTTLTGLFGIIPLCYLVPQKPTLNYYIIANSWAFIASGFTYLFLKTTGLISFDQIILLSFTTLFSALATINLSIYLIREKIPTYNWALFSQPFVLILFILFFYNFQSEFSILHYIYSLFGSYVFLFILSIPGSIRYFREMEKVAVRNLGTDTKKMFRYGFYNQTALLFQMISFRGSFYILEKFSSIQDVGIFSNAVSIVESIWIINRSLSLVFYSRIINSKSKAYSNEVFKKFSIISFWLLGLVIFFLILIPSNFYAFLFGDDFVTLKSVIVLLIPGTVFFGQSLIITHYFSGTGKHHINLISNSVGMIIILSTSYFLIPSYSIIGASIASNIGYFSIFLVQFYFIRQIYKVTLLDQVFDKRWFTELLESLRSSLLKLKM